MRPWCACALAGSAATTPARAATRTRVEGVALAEHCPPGPGDYSSRRDVSNRRRGDKATWRDNDRQSSPGRQDEFDRARSVDRTTNRADPRDVDDAAQLGALGRPLSRARSSGARAGLAGPRRRAGRIRRDPSPLEGLSIPDVIDHYEQIIRELDAPPIIIGHSFGGLFAQLLLNRGLGSAGAALGTGAPKGVLRLPLLDDQGRLDRRCTTRSARTTSHRSPRSSSLGFTNSLSREDSERSTSATTSPGPHARSSRPATRTSTRTQRRRSTTGTRTGRRSSWSRGPRTASARLRSGREGLA